MLAEGLQLNAVPLFFVIFGKNHLQRIITLHAYTSAQQGFSLGT